MKRDLHQEPFDEGTKVKLSIFRDYLRTWLAICSTLPWLRHINIFDFFSGPGMDKTGYKGTPLIIVDELIPYLASSSLSIGLYLNEYDKHKYESLKEIVSEALQSPPDNLKIDFESSDFKEAFTKQIAKMSMSSSMNLLFLDQSGIKQVNEEVFLDLINIKRADFIAFISSSTVKRFPDHPAIQQYIELNKDAIASTPYHQIHRLILDYYKNLIPVGKEYYLGSFSLKKNSGVYGLIFGSNSILGIEKFLETCWKFDPDRGEANFDIDDDRIVHDQPDLFTGQVRKPKKRDLFERELREGVLSRKLQSNRDVYLFGIRNGFLAKDSRRVIKQLQEEGSISRKPIDLSNKVCKHSAVLTTIEVI